MAGRKGFEVEAQVQKVINLSIDTIKRLLMRDDLTVEQQIKIAVPILVKRMPQEITGVNVNSTVTNVVINTIKSLSDSELRAILEQKPSGETLSRIGTVSAESA